MLHVSLSCWAGMLLLPFRPCLGFPRSCLGWRCFSVLVSVEWVPWFLGLAVTCCNGWPSGWGSWALAWFWPGPVSGACSYLPIGGVAVVLVLAGILRNCCSCVYNFALFWWLTVLNMTGLCFWWCVACCRGPWPDLSQHLARPDFLVVELALAFSQCVLVGLRGLFPAGCSTGGLSVIQWSSA